MAYFEFKEDCKKIKCIYQFESGYEMFNLEKSDTKDGIRIKNTFFINRDIEHKIIDENTIEFVIGKVDKNYYRLDKNVFETKHSFYFDKNMKLKKEYFFQSHRISILKKIDRIIKNDLYIGGDKVHAINEEIYINLINHFPNQTEYIKYQNMRIEYLCENYLPTIKDNKTDYNNYINKKDKNLIDSGLKIDKKIIELEYEKYEYILEKLKEMLKESEKYSENHWQTEIAKILMLLNFNYIGFLEKLRIPIEEEGKFREPDFILVDSRGFIDIIEIKRADNIQILNNREYRNNYIPSQELSGAIIQCNKYCFWLSQNRKNNEKLISKKIKEKYDIDIKINIRNPKFTIILGRSKEFTEKQKKDFRTINTQYNNVNEILSYDDVIKKLERLLDTFRKKLK